MYIATVAIEPGPSPTQVRYVRSYRVYIYVRSHCGNRTGAIAHTGKSIN